MRSGTAYLSNEGEYSTFSFGEKTITFLTGNNLVRYTRVKEWDHGYLVVLCQTKSNPIGETEDYIDLMPILENLYMEPETFVQDIKEVQIRYA